MSRDSPSRDHNRHLTNRSLAHQVLHCSHLLHIPHHHQGDEASEDEQEFEDDVVLDEIGDNSDDEEEATDAEEQTEIDDSESDDNENFDKDEDIADDDNDNSDSGDLEISDILCTTKSGRTCRTWRRRYLYY